MRHQRPALLREVGIDGVEHGVIGHQVRARRRFQFHAHILPDLDHDRAALKGLVEPSRDLARVVELVAAGEIEGRSEAELGTILLPELLGPFLARHQQFGSVPTQADVRDAGARAPKHFHELWHVVKDVHMHVNLQDVLEAGYGLSRRLSRT